MKSWNIDRRAFLRGAGAAVPLPFLNLMEASASNFRNEGKPPTRFMTLFKPNGVYPPSWNINDGTEHDFRLSPLMQPFAKHKDELLILDNMGDFGFSSHSHSTRRFLAGHHSNTRSATMDQLIADQIGGETAIRSLELTTEGLFTNQIGCSYISYDSKGQPIPRESDPQIVFDRIFRNPNVDPTKRREMNSLLDRVSEDAKSLIAKSGAEDKRTLDQYLSVVRETEKRLGNLKTADAKLLPENLKRPLSATNLDEQVESMLDLIALAMWTDSTRCVTYMLGNSNSRMIFDFLGIKKQHHYLSHFFRNSSRENLEALLKISEWHMKKFDSLLTRLKNYKDHNGTLLDHSLVLYGSGMGHSDNHTAKRIPIILAGGKNMIKTGRYVRYSENQRLSSLHLAIIKKFGVKTDSFGLADSPLPGLDGSDFQPYQERPFASWIKREGLTVTVQGRLRMSDKFDEAKVFFLDVKDKPAVRIEVAFGDFHKFNLAYHTGTPITLVGQATGESGAIVIKKVTSVKSVFGKKPGDAAG